MSTTEKPAAPNRWTAQWKELKAEVIDTGLCTGCSGCVVTCPHDVIGYEHEEGKYLPFHLESELGPDNCVHGEKGCTTCTRACPRFGAWGGPKLWPAPASSHGGCESDKPCHGGCESDKPCA